jgi:HNH endonuclease
MHDDPTIPARLCGCGCGATPPIAPRTRPKLGLVKGQPNRFIRGHQTRQSPDEYAIDPETGCWLWLRGVISTSGYGSTTVDGKRVPAHRAIYERHRGPIPEGMTLDHVCHTNDLKCPGGISCLHRRCVNPDHLEPVPFRTNVLRGRSMTALNAAKDQCPRGHPYDAANTYIQRRLQGDRIGFGRICRTCRRDYERRRRAGE